MDRPRSHLHPLVLLSAALAVFAVGFAYHSARSEANVYCVSTISQAGCTNSSTGVQTQLNSAESNPGHDEVWIFPGSYTGNFHYDNTDTGNSITIEGRGDTPGETTLTLGDSTGFGIALDVNATAGSAVKNLHITVPANDDGSVDTGLYATGTNEGDLDVGEIEIDGPHASNMVGIICGNCVVRDSHIDLTSDGQYSNSAMWQVGGPAHVEDSEMIADTGLVHGSPNEHSTIDHSRIEAHVGASTDGGFIDISDTLIQLDDEPGAIGANFHNGNNPVSPVVIGGSLDHVTIVNGVDNSTDNSIGIAAIADTATETVNVNLTNSVIAGFTNFPSGRTLDTGVNFSGVLNFTSEYSAYDNGMVAQFYDGDGSNLHYSLGDHHVHVGSDAGFIDPASGDYRPGADSPLLDAGDPADPPLGATDISGNPRACHGTPDGVIRRDIGAYEYKSDPDDDCTYPETSMLDGPEAYPPAMYTGHTMKFELGSSKQNSTFRCTIDGASIPCAASFTTPELEYGAHSFTAAAVDQYGNVDQSPVVSDFYLTIPKGPPPTCKDTPALCPDKTAPKVVGLKAPKKTRALKVKVRFKSSEKGSTFECRLNKGKFKRCKSPWKTPKLKKGKNTIAIRATDQAGNKSKAVKRVVKKVTKKKAKRR